MRDYAKTGGKKSRPGYRTPSSFRGLKSLENIRFKAKGKELEGRRAIRYNKISDRKV